ncbi:MAG: hypothetical protein H6Q04_908 [Acidobacteria bacterium]|nr:hypothetical protein [Acidobacteriota bacterium]
MATRQGILSPDGLPLDLAFLVKERVHVIFSDNSHTRIRGPWTLGSIDLPPVLECGNRVVFQPVKVMERNPFLHDAILGQSVLDCSVLNIGQHVVVPVHGTDLDLARLPCLLEGTRSRCSGSGVDTDDHIKVRVGLDQLGSNSETVSRVGFLVHFGDDFDSRELGENNW